MLGDTENYTVSKDKKPAYLHVRALRKKSADNMGNMRNKKDV